MPSLQLCLVLSCRRCEQNSKLGKHLRNFLAPNVETVLFSRGNARVSGGQGTDYFGVPSLPLPPLSFLPLLSPSLTRRGFRSRPH